MNKAIYPYLLVLFLAWPKWVVAQTWDELFRQKETQKEYLLLQIGALRVQSGLLKEAGQIAKVGLQTIGTYRAVEKNLHDDFFKTFRVLGPRSIESLFRISQSGIHPEGLKKRINKSLAHWKSQSSDPLFTQWTELIHLGMWNKCVELADELLRIAGEGYQLQDADRASHLDGLGEQLSKLSHDLGAVQLASLFRLSQARTQAYSLQFLDKY